MIEIKGNHGKSFLLESMWDRIDVALVLDSAYFHSRDNLFYVDGVTIDGLVSFISEQVLAGKRSFVIYSNKREVDARPFIKTIKGLEKSLSANVLIAFMYYG